MGQDTHESPTAPATGTDYPLTELLQRGARRIGDRPQFFSPST